MKRKILIDARMYGLEHTGIGRYLIKLINNLKVLETEFDFIVTLRKKYYETLLFPSNWKKVRIDIKHYTLAEQLLLPFLIKYHQPDLVHFPHLNIPLLYSGKYVITLHDLTMKKQGKNASKLTMPMYLLKRLPFNLVSKKAIINAQQIITPSLSVATEVCNTYGILENKVTAVYEGGPTIPQGFAGGDLNILSEYGLVNVDYFLYVGNAYPHKNLEIAIDAIKDLNENKNLQVSLVIGGSNDFFAQRLNSYIRSKSAGNYVKLLGFVKEKDLPTLYSNAVGFVYPSLSEGFGLQGLEAIAYGTTLLCSNIDVFKEIYGTHAFYFDPKKLESVSGTMFSVYNLKKSERNTYLRKAQDFILKYSWKENAKQTLEVYKEVFKSL